MQKVDGAAADALNYIEARGSKPTDPEIRNAWSRYLMSLIHRSPERVKYLTAKVKEYEDGELNPDLMAKYASLRSPNDPPTYEARLEAQGSLTPDLRVRLLKMLIDSDWIGSTLNAMHWKVYTLENPRFGFLTGDLPIIISNGLGLRQSFVVLPISPTQLFMAAHDLRVIESFATQRPNALEQAFNDACTQQSRHVIIGHDDRQTSFIERRFLNLSAPLERGGLCVWNGPLVEL